MRSLGGLRVRVTLLVVAVVAVCLGVAFVAVYRQTAADLERRTGSDLRSDMAPLERAVATGSAAPRAVAARARRFLASAPFRPTTHVVYVVAPGAPAVSNQPELLGLTALGEHEPAPTKNAERRAAAALLSAPPGRRLVPVPDAGRIDLLVRAVHRDGRLIARLGVGEPTAASDRARHAVGAAFLLAGGLGVLAALIGAGLVASRIAAPLRRMASVAARVDRGELAPRMDVHGRADEVGVLAESFNHMLDRLQDAFDRQSAFVADASHELRTPLTVISGQLEVLALEERPAPEEVRRVERMVHTEIDRMRRLVEDMLLLAQAGDDGFLRPAAVDLRPFLTELVRGMAALAPVPLVLEPVAPLVLEADPDRLAQALRNLLRNAIEHTDERGAVRLTVHATATSVRFVVDDDGPGIPPEERDAVFDRFHRLDAARSREAGGAGLGLAIVQAIARAHGGRAWAATPSAGGARLVIELPLRRPPR
jgi:two-component system OmpR family sensor kinase